MKLNKMLVLSALASLLIGIQSANARPLSEINDAKNIAVVTGASSPPFGFLNPQTNTLDGVMVEVSEAVAKHLGVTEKLTSAPFSGLISTLTSGRVDLMSAPLFITPERSKVIDFSDPVWEWGEGLVVKATSDIQVKHFEDLKGYKIGVLVDSVQFNMIKDMPDTRVTTYPDYITLLSDVRAGRIDLGIVDPPSVLFQIKNKQLSGFKMMAGYQPQKTWQVGLAVEKGNSDLLAGVNSALAAMKKSGELKAIGEKWNISELLSQ